MGTEIYISKIGTEVVKRVKEMGMELDENSVAIIAGATIAVMSENTSREQYLIKSLESVGDKYPELAKASKDIIKYIDVSALLKSKRELDGKA